MNIMSNRVKNLMGQKFGRLTVIDFVGLDNWGRAKWKCQCQCKCGSIKVVRGGNLTGGSVRSCGCLATEQCVVNFSHREKPTGVAAFNRLFYYYKTSAKNNKRTFELSREQFRKLTSARCFYCNEEPFQLASTLGHSNVNGDYVYNGIDRQDSKKGYTLDNCVPCCWKCNKMKGTMSADEFLACVNKIAAYRVNKCK